MNKFKILLFLIIATFFVVANNENKEVFEKLLKEAEQGDAKAQFNLGWHFHIGEGVEKNLEKAVYWYERSATQEYVKAQFTR